MDMFSDDYDDEEVENITSSLLKKVESCDITYLALAQQNITFNEYLKLTATKKVEDLFFDFVKITDENGIVVSLDRIMARLPNVHNLVIKGGYRGESIFTADSAKKLVELPRFEKLWALELNEITSDFNVDDFCDFILVCFCKGGYRGESIFTADAAKKLVELPRFEKLW
uniref:Uncharacterized protein n=1 Tax=Panagrolaimus sp. ES5 TaxID=591445 RepID=A0AC34GDW9_9BILA